MSSSFYFSHRATMPRAISRPATMRPIPQRSRDISLLAGEQDFDRLRSDKVLRHQHHDRQQGQHEQGQPGLCGRSARLQRRGAPLAQRPREVREGSRDSPASPSLQTDHGSEQGEFRQPDPLRRRPQRDAGIEPRHQPVPDVA